jgi:hypothetical protein
MGQSVPMNEAALLEWNPDSQWKFYDINYLNILNLVIIWHCIYKKRDKTSFMVIKLVQLISNILKII